MRLLKLIVVPVLSAALLAQTSVGNASAPSRHTSPHKKMKHAADLATKSDLQALKEQLAVQQQEIQQLMDELKKRDAQWQQSQQQLSQAQTVASQAQTQAATAQSAAQQNSNSVGQLQDHVTSLQADNLTVQKSVAEVQKKQKSGVQIADGKLTISGVAYGQYGAYYNTGFGPQFITQTSFPGPGNDHFNSFDITRAYLNFVYAPNDAITLRLMPNVYRQYSGAACTVTGGTCSATNADKIGKVTGFGSSADGNLTLRLKAAYIDFNKLFSRSSVFGSDVLTIGQQTNPLLDWEEGLYGYRFVSLVPWNYLGLSSTQAGVSLHGPIKFGGKQYIDYAIGAFNQSNYHQFEQAESKQVMARVSFYPFGADSKYQGLGLTGFLDYGYKNVAPDTANAPLYRAAAIIHYASRHNGYGIAGEYDTGRNAFAAANLFSGSAPADLFGGLSSPTQYANLTALSVALLGQNGAFLQDVAFFGHAALPNTPLTLIGMYNYTRPNTNVASDPLDFDRSVVGIAWKVNPHLRFALDAQNLHYIHGQFTFPAVELSRFSASLAAQNPGGIANAVPNDTGAIFVHSEFSF